MKMIDANERTISKTIKVLAVKDSGIKTPYPKFVNPKML